MANSPFRADKNSKEQFIKKLHLCMKTYDYKDEQKDVKGKVRTPQHDAKCPIYRNVTLFLEL